MREPSTDSSHTNSNAAPLSSSTPTGIESSYQKRTIFENAEEESFWKISFEIDIVAFGLFVLAAATRFYNLTYPQSIV